MITRLASIALASMARWLTAGVQDRAFFVTQNNMMTRLVSVLLNLL